MILAALVGFVLAFVGSIPMSGPVAALFLSRALGGERRAALLIGVGSALVEALYALGAALLLPRLVARTREIVLGSLGLGAVVVLTLGAILLVRPRLLERTSEGGARRGFVQGALSSLFNPTLVATWTLAVGALYANDLLRDETGVALAFAAGVAAGSVGWLSFVLLLGALFHIRPTEALRQRALRLVGTLMLASGVFLAVRFVTTLFSSGTPTTPVRRIPQFIEKHAHHHGS